MTVADPPGAQRDAAAAARPALPFAWRGAILALAVAEFLVGHGAVWEHMFDWDVAILRSYASIPALVLAALLLRRRLAFVPWLVHTIEVSGAKLVLTAGFLVVLMASRHDPDARPPAPRPSEPRAAVSDPAPQARRQRAPTPLDPASTGTLRGVVTAPDGAPAAGALVWVARGLGDRVFEVPPRTLHIENDGRRIAPALDGVMLGQPVVARSRNGELHTLWVRPLDDVNALMNVSVLGSGAPARVSFPDAFEGIATVECAVHRAREGKARLGLFRHPYFGRTDAQGAFELSGVPAGALGLAAYAPELGRAEASVTVAAGRAASVDLALQPAAAAR